MFKSLEKATVVVPKHLISGFVTDFYLNLLEALNSFYEISVFTLETFDPQDCKETVFIISIAHWEYFQEKIFQIKNDRKIIVWHDDMYFKKKEEIEINTKLFHRANLILSPNKSTFELLWPEYKDKFIWMPLFASNYFYMEFNQNPLKKCLLSGRIAVNHYPLRHFVKNSQNSFIDVYKHPGYRMVDNNKKGRNYAQIINNYFCCITDSGKTYASMKYQTDKNIRTFDVDDYLNSKNINIEKFKNVGQVLLKNFEITASGSLLLTDQYAPEIEMLGFKDGENYICVNQNNVMEKIEDCCVNWKKYNEIRYNGWLLSKKLSVKLFEEKFRKYVKNLQRK